jgi:glycosyltransferase involved in cell wall biosynthesis
MSPSIQNLLVVSHDATRTGAPRVAVEILRSLGSNDTQVVGVLRAGGPMADEFALNADRAVQEPFPRVRATLRRRPRLHGLLNRWDELVAGRILRRHRPAAVILNTVRAANYLAPALRQGIPAVLYVHETGSWAWDVLRRHPIGDRWDEVRLLACSTACREELAGAIGVPEESIEVVHAPVDVADVRRRAGRRAAAPPSATDAGLLVGACGTVEDRKGTDLWLRVARQVRAERPELDVRFQWIGRQKGTWSQELTDELGLTGIVDFTGEINDPAPLVARLDVFTLPSRRDPFPLVVLEAMALARPIVAFDVGGVAEQLGDAGVVVPPEDVDTMAKTVIGLLDDESARRSLGRQGEARVQEHWDVHVLFRPAIRRIVAELTAAADTGTDADGPPKP